MTRRDAIEELARRDREGSRFVDLERSGRWMLSAPYQPARARHARRWSRVVALALVWCAAVEQVHISGHGPDGFTLAILAGGVSLTIWATHRA